MWMITRDGFYSAVEHRDQRDKVLVRARAEEDLKNLRRRYLPGIKIEKSPAADYPFRALVAKDDWAGAVAEMAADIDYDNFKNTIKDNRRHGLYLRIWSVLRGIGKPEPTYSYGGYVPPKWSDELYNDDEDAWHELDDLDPEPTNKGQRSLFPWKRR